MDPKQIKQFLIPAVAATALIVVVAIIVSGGSSSKQAGDASFEGMSDKMPSSEGVDWKPVHSGLKVLDVKEGSGEPVTKGQRVAMHYTGWRASDGGQFDTSRNKTPLEMPLKTGRVGLIEGWVDGVPGMKAGGIRRIFIPWPLGYGEGGNGPDIPPKTDLIFEVKLIAFQ